MTCLFWKDNWAGQCIEATYPELFSFAKKRDISVAEANAHDDLAHMFYLPVSEMAYNQLQALNQTVSDTHISEDKDI